jgi:four helix bundle protein
MHLRGRRGKQGRQGPAKAAGSPLGYDRQRRPSTICRSYGASRGAEKGQGSVMDNIAEGFDDFSTREFLKFLGYSLRSCSEVQSQLYRALDCRYVDQRKFDEVYTIAEDCKVQIRSFMKYLRNRKA